MYYRCSRVIRTYISVREITGPNPRMANKKCSQRSKPYGSIINHPSNSATMLYIITENPFSTHRLMKRPVPVEFKYKSMLKPAFIGLLLLYFAILCHLLSVNHVFVLHCSLNCVIIVFCFSLKLYVVIFTVLKPSGVNIRIKN